MHHRHIINGCSIDLSMLTERELASLIRGNQARIASLNSELHILVDEHIRRVDNQSIHATPTLF